QAAGGAGSERRAVQGADRSIADDGDVAGAEDRVRTGSAVCKGSVQDGQDDSPALPGEKNSARGRAERRARPLENDGAAEVTQGHEMTRMPKRYARLALITATAIGWATAALAQLGGGQTGGQGGGVQVGSGAETVQNPFASGGAANSPSN